MNRMISALATMLVGAVMVMPIVAAERWQDPSVNQVNREARRAHFFAFETESLALGGNKAA